ncbi:MAG: hypothetical protein EAY75_14485 [Bacteroidetes bacterium]|nr:MAG: hypothetical protein EAY75_14485 [Bacteroidota bacterium]
MKANIFLVCIAFAVPIFTLAQNVGIGTTTPHASAMLDINSTTKGILLPRMDSIQRNAIASPAQGLLIYQTKGNGGLYHYFETHGPR